jgi:hypothetical protein
MGGGIEFGFKLRDGKRDMEGGKWRGKWKDVKMGWKQCKGRTSDGLTFVGVDAECGEIAIGEKSDGTRVGD